MPTHIIRIPIEKGQLTLTSWPKDLQDQQKLYRVSASAIKDWQACQRLWGFHRILKLRSPETPSQSLGKLLHGVLEEWCIEGKLPSEYDNFLVKNTPRFFGKMALAGLHLLPPPKTGAAEVEFLVQLDQNPWAFYGFIDWLISRKVLDHKTTTDFKWALTPEELSTDSQAILYAARALFDAPLGSDIEAQWTYFLTHGTPQVRAVNTSLSLAHITAQLQRFSAIAAEIYQAKQTIEDPMELAPNTGSCGNYGGCHFNPKCNIPPKERFRRAMGFDVQQFIADQKSKQGEAPESPPTIPTAAPTAPQPPAAPTAPPVATVAPIAPLAPTVPVSMPPVAVQAPPTLATPASAPVSVPASAPVIAPAESPLNGWERADLKAAAVALGIIPENSRMRKTGLITELIKAQGMGLTIPTPNAPQAPAAPAAPPEPTAAEVAAYAAQQAAQAPQPPAAPAAAPMPAAAPQPPAAPPIVAATPAMPMAPPAAPAAVPEAVGLDTLPAPVPKLLNVLYINCTPLNPTEDTWLLSDILGPILRDLSPEGDYRLHPDLQFGKASGALTEAVLERLANYNGASIVACTSYAEHRDVLQSLEARATTIVKSL